MDPQERAQLRVLQLLEKNADVSQRELARELGISLGKTNFLLRALVDKGLVKARNFRRSNNKLAYSYLLTPQGLANKASLTRQYLEGKLSEYEALRLEIDKLRSEIGRVD